MDNLKKLDLIQPIKEFISKGKPFMGICLGLQLLFSESQEFGRHQGLDIIKGSVKKFPKINPKNEQVKIPQIGWNTIYKGKKTQSWDKTPFEKISQNEFMYFIHSYFTDPSDQKVILSLTNYSGIEYCSSIMYKNVFATQFHPEKSGPEGIKIYQNWASNISKDL
jgi:glutamine amidotransferase